jgi:hypothetical protein
LVVLYEGKNAHAVKKSAVLFNVEMCSTLNYHYALKHVCQTFLLQGATPIIVG